MNLINDETKEFEAFIAFYENVGRKLDIEFEKKKANESYKPEEFHIRWGDGIFDTVKEEAPEDEMEQSQILHKRFPVFKQVQAFVDKWHSSDENSLLEKEFLSMNKLKQKAIIVAVQMNQKQLLLDGVKESIIEDWLPIMIELSNRNE